MASKYYTFTGPLRWIKNITPDEKYQNYCVDVNLDDENLAKLKESGAQLQVKTDEEGSWVRFRRPVQKIIKNDLVKMGPPKVTDEKGSDTGSIKIANGSLGVVTVVVYDTQKGKGHRWEALKLTKLIPYEPPVSAELPTATEATGETPKSTRPF